MLSFFKSNNPAVVVFYVLYLGLFRICLIFFPVDTNFVFAHHEPLSSLFFDVLKNFSANYQGISAMLAAVLCFIQALLINGVVNENKIFAKKNYTAGAVYIIFASFFKEALLLTPASLALTFIILATARIFSLAKKEKSYGDVFDIGFLVALASLFYFPCLLFLLFAYIGLATVRAFHYREWVIILLGFLSPFLIAFTFYYWNDKASMLPADIANLHSGVWLATITLKLTDRIMIGGMAFCTIACLLLLPASLYSSLIQVRKFSNTLVVAVVLIFVAMLLQQTVHLSHLVLLALPVGIISAMAFNQIKRTALAEVIHLILILLVLAGQFLPLFNIN